MSSAWTTVKRKKQTRKKKPIVRVAAPIPGLNYQSDARQQQPRHYTPSTAVSRPRRQRSTDPIATTAKIAHVSTSDHAMYSHKEWRDKFITAPRYYWTGSSMEAEDGTVIDADRIGLQIKISKGMVKGGDVVPEIEEFKLVDIVDWYDEGVEAGDFRTFDYQVFPMAIVYQETPLNDTESYWPTHNAFYCSASRAYAKAQVTNNSKFGLFKDMEHKYINSATAVHIATNMLVDLMVKMSQCPEEKVSFYVRVFKRLALVARRYCLTDTTFRTALQRLATTTEITDIGVSAIAAIVCAQLDLTEHFGKLFRRIGSRCARDSGKRGEQLHYIINLCQKEGGNYSYRTALHIAGILYFLNTTVNVAGMEDTIPALIVKKRKYLKAVLDKNSMRISSTKDAGSFKSAVGRSSSTRVDYTRTNERVFCATLLDTEFGTQLGLPHSTAESKKLMVYLLYDLNLPVPMVLSKVKLIDSQTLPNGVAFSGKIQGKDIPIMTMDRSMDGTQIELHPRAEYGCIHIPAGVTIRFVTALEYKHTTLSYIKVGAMPEDQKVLKAPWSKTMDMKSFQVSVTDTVTVTQEVEGVVCNWVKPAPHGAYVLMFHACVTIEVV